MCHILCCSFWSVYGVFSDFGDVLDARFLLEEALIHCCVPVRRSGTNFVYQTV